MGQPHGVKPSFIRWRPKYSTEESLDKEFALCNPAARDLRHDPQGGRHTASGPAWARRWLVADWARVAGGGAEGGEACEVSEGGARRVAGRSQGDIGEGDVTHAGTLAAQSSRVGKLGPLRPSAAPICAHAEHLVALPALWPVGRRRKHLHFRAKPMLLAGNSLERP